MDTLPRGVSGTDIPALTTPGLSSCVEDERLFCDGAPLRCSPFEVAALRLVEWADAHRSSIALVPIDPLAPLTALIPAAVHVASIVKGRRLDSGAAGLSARTVAVVTSDYRTKGLYRRLGISAGRGLGSAPMRTVVPAATMTRDGNVLVLDANDRSWSTLFVPDVKSLDGVHPDLVVVDLPAWGSERLMHLNVPVIGVIRDPADRHSLSLFDGKPVFAWSGVDLNEVDTTALTARLRAHKALVDVHVVSVMDPVLCENAGLFWADIGPLVRSSRNSAVAAVAQESHELFHDLLGLAAPLEVLENLHGSAAARISAVGASSRIATSEARDLYLPMVEAELNGMLDAIGDAPPKANVLLRVLGHHLEERKVPLLVARTAPLARAYADWLSRSGLRSVRTAPLGSLFKEEPADVAVLTGLAPRWARWVYRTGIAAQLQVLAYDSDRSSGFSEARIAATTIDEQRTLAARLVEMRSDSWRVLTNQQETLASVTSQRNGSDHSPTLIISAPDPPDEPPGLWDDRNWWASYAPESSVAGPTSEDPAIVNAIRVAFTDGSSTLLDDSRTVTLWRPHSGEAEPGVMVGDVRVGDLLVLLDGDGHKDLFDKVVEASRTVPEIAVAGSWLGHWRAALQRARARFGSYVQLTDALRARGCRVQPQTVRLWVIGITIGPQDPEDVRRLGEVLEDSTIVNAHREIVTAMRTLRGAYVSLRRRLANLARQHAQSGVTHDVDEVVDERSGLTIADLQQVVEVVTVATIEPVGPIARVATGIRINEEPS